MAEVVITEFMAPEGVARLAAARDTLYNPDLVDDRNLLLEAVADARALVVRNLTIVDRELLDAAPALIVIGRLGVGLDNIDLDACRERGITVRATTNGNAISVAEYVIGATLSLMRPGLRSSSRVVAGEWPQVELAGREVASLTLGLIGYGTIARAVAGRAIAFGMNVIASDPHIPADDQIWDEVDRVEPSELLARADVISLHVPLTDDTRHMIGEEEIAAMSPGTLLINASRGGIVDEDAVVAALRSGHLGGAALDVFVTEPVDAAGGARFADVPNLIVTPHLAGATTDSNRRISEAIAAAVLDALE
jgi:(S)-sulfolactate dehydrogenase